MRLAANDIERSLKQAADENDRARRPATSAELDELAGAFRRADELSRSPFGRAMIEGRKDRVLREVLTTQFTKVVGKVTYRYVLQAFSDTQMRCARRSDVGGLDKRRTPTYYQHLLLVRDDRLRR